MRFGGRAGDGSEGRENDGENSRNVIMRERKFRRRRLLVGNMPEPINRQDFLVLVHKLNTAVVSV